MKILRINSCHENSASDAVADRRRAYLPDLWLSWALTGLRAGASAELHASIDGDSRGGQAQDQRQYHTPEYQRHLK